MLVGKFDSIFLKFKEDSMKNTNAKFEDGGIIEDDFETMKPYLEMAYKLGMGESVK